MPNAQWMAALKELAPQDYEKLRLSGNLNTKENAIFRAPVSPDDVTLENFKKIDEATAKKIS